MPINARSYGTTNQLCQWGFGLHYCWFCLIFFLSNYIAAINWTKACCKHSRWAQPAKLVCASRLQVSLLLQIVQVAVFINSSISDPFKASVSCLLILLWEKALSSSWQSAKDFRMAWKWVITWWKHLWYYITFILDHWQTYFRKDSNITQILVLW